MYALGSTMDSRVKASSGFPAFCAYDASLSRSGPIFCVAPAGLNVWQPPQPFAAKTLLPADCPLPCAPPPAAAPVVVCSVVAGMLGTVPITVCGSGFAIFSPPQPMSANAASRSGTRRRMARESTAPQSTGTPLRLARGGWFPDETQGSRPRRRPLVPDVVDRRVAWAPVRRLRGRALPGPERRARPDDRDHRGDG